MVEVGTAIAVIVALALFATYALRRRRLGTVTVPQAAGRYEIIAGRARWSGNDSREASRVIEGLRAEGRAWRMLVDGVEKKRGG